MSKWFECKAKYERLTEDGTQKKVTEPYMVNALSFTEAEARITEELAPYISGEFTVDAVKKTNIAEIFRDPTADNNTDRRWFKVKINIITLDEKTGVEKKSAINSLVEAPDFQHAVNNFNEGMKGTMADFEIHTVAETPIMDVFDEKLGNYTGEQSETQPENNPS